MAVNTFLFAMAAVIGIISGSSFSDSMPSTLSTSSEPIHHQPPPPPRPPLPGMSDSGPRSTFSPSQPSSVTYGSSPLSHYLKYSSSIKPDNSVVSSNHQLAKPVDKFATTMYELVTQANPTKNIVISPLSIQTILSLVAMGARGTTETKMAAALNFPSSNIQTVANDYQQMLAPYQNNTMLSMANAIYVSNKCTIQSAFQEIAINQFYANVQTVNYGNPTDAAEIINTWVSNKTDNNINSLLSPSMLSTSSESAAMVLVNAVYFNGLWETPFHHRMKPNITFFGPNCKKSGKVNMMKVMGNFNFGIIPSLNATVLQLPYKNSTFSMLIFLPANCTQYSSFNNIFGNFDFTTLHSQMYYRFVDVNLPTFTSSFEIANMMPELKAVGMGVLFNNPDLSGILDTMSGSAMSGVIGAVVHKAQIKVNQLGAEAAAATAVIEFGEGAPNPPKDPVPPVTFHVDRSFTYAIMDKQTCIFIGQYLQPESS